MCIRDRQYYRDIQKLSDALKAEVVDLQQQKETAREELRRAKKEIQTIMQVLHVCSEMFPLLKTGGI